MLEDEGASRTYAFEVRKTGEVISLVVQGKDSPFCSAMGPLAPRPPHAQCGQQNKTDLVQWKADRI